MHPPFSPGYYRWRLFIAILDKPIVQFVLWSSVLILIGLGIQVGWVRIRNWFLVGIFLFYAFYSVIRAAIAGGIHQLMAFRPIAHTFTFLHLSGAIFRMGALLSFLGAKRLAGWLLEMALVIYRSAGDLRGRFSVLGEIVGLPLRYHTWRDIQEEFERVRIECQLEELNRVLNKVTRELTLPLEKASEAHLERAIRVLTLALDSFRENRANRSAQAEAIVSITLAYFHEKQGKHNLAQDRCQYAAKRLKHVIDHEMMPLTWESRQPLVGGGVVQSFAKPLLQELEALPDELVWFVLFLLAVSYADQRDFDRAYEYCLKAIGRIERARIERTADLARLRFLTTDKAMVYDFAMQLLLRERLKDANPVSSDEARTVFEFVERAKARALLDLLQLSDVPDEESLSSACSEEGRILIRGEEAKVRSLEQIQQDLPEGTTLLEYYVSDTLLLGFVVTRHRLEVPIFLVKRKLQDEVAEILANIKGFCRSIAELDSNNRPRQKSLTQIKMQAQDLYTKLVKPTEPSWVSGAARRLIVVPHGTLHHLPFCALFDGEKFLAERIPLSQAPSASALHYLYRRRPKLDPLIGESYLGLANPTGDEQIYPEWKDPYYTIRVCKYVVKGAARWYFNGQRVKLFMGREATRKSFLDNCGRYTFVDLECHGDYDAYDPLAAAVVLRGEDDEPSRLTLLEIVKEVRFHPGLQLLTLAICYGAEADMTAGDDPVGLIRASFAAGARSILACGWAVPDTKSTHRFLHTFYECLIKKGQVVLSKDEALQRAQVNLIERGRRGEMLKGGLPTVDHPYCWAWALFGDHEAYGKP